MEFHPAYTISVPVAQWFFVQAWLTQHYMLPVQDYIVYPGYPACTLAFYRLERYEHFVLRWAAFLGTVEDGDSTLDGYYKD